MLAGAGCAGVWTFGRDLMADEGDLPDRVTGLLWCILGAAGLVGGISGVLVARAGLRLAWISTVVVAGAATALLGARPGDAALAGVALACFGSAFVALTGVLLAWAAERNAAAAPGGAVVLFVGLTVGQAVGAGLVGAVAGMANPQVAFSVAAGLLVLSAGAAPVGALRRGSGSAPEPVNPWSRVTRILEPRSRRTSSCGPGTPRRRTLASRCP